MKRTLFQQEHEIFRKAFRKFLEKEVIPYHEQWEKDGVVSREVWEKAGEQGFLCPWLPEEYGGYAADFLYSVIIIEESVKARNHGFAISLHNDVVVPYVFAFGNEDQKKTWMPKLASGKCISAVAMTEPGAGSDLASISTTAVKDGDDYIINGAKTFISNGILCDLCVVAVKTDTKANPPHTGVSLVLVEADRKGFGRGRNLEKIGMHAQDTAELSFEDCRIPQSNLLGDEGMGFIYLMQKLQQERLVCSIAAQTGAESVLDITVKYTKERQCFGKPLSKFQNTRFKLAEMATEIALGRTFNDKLIEEHMAGANVVTETCMAKWWTSEMLKRASDEGLRLHGGYGYMMEYPIAKAYLDARVQTIYAGTTEIMKGIIGRQMGL